MIVKFTFGKMLERVFKERIFLDIQGLAFRQNHQFHEVIDKKIQQFFEAGLINYYNAGWKELFNPKHPQYMRYKAKFEPGGPQVLTMTHLQAGFVIWLVSICVAIVVFLMELLNKFLQVMVWRCLRGSVKTILNNLLNTR